MIAETRNGKRGMVMLNMPKKLISNKLLNEKIDYSNFIVSNESLYDDCTRIWGLLVDFRDDLTSKRKPELDIVKVYDATYPANALSMDLSGRDLIYERSDCMGNLDAVRSYLIEKNLIKDCHPILPAMAKATRSNPDFVSWLELKYLSSTDNKRS